MKLGWEENAGAADNAMRVLPAVARAYFAAGRALSARRLNHRRLHGFRLETKRLRYTLELFRPLYGRGMETRLHELRGVQSRLGKISDLASIRDLVAGDAALVQELDEQASKKTGEFLEFWRSVFDAPGREEQWARYLGGLGQRRGPRLAERRVPTRSEPQSRSA